MHREAVLFSMAIIGDNWRSRSPSILLFGSNGCAFHAKKCTFRQHHLLHVCRYNRHGNSLVSQFHLFLGTLNREKKTSNAYNGGRVRWQEKKYPWKEERGMTRKVAKWCDWNGRQSDHHHHHRVTRVRGSIKLPKKRGVLSDSHKKTTTTMSASKHHQGHRVIVAQAIEFHIFERQKEQHSANWIWHCAMRHFLLFSASPPLLLPLNLHKQ